MTERIIVSNKEQIEVYRAKILDNISLCVDRLNNILKEHSAIDAFIMMKFDKVGIEPISGEEENIIEVINQVHTYLVSIKAVEYLLDIHSNKSFIINWGNISGYDIESSDGEIIAECFAATSYRSNGKLNADIKRLDANNTALIKYVFFYDKEFKDKNKTYYNNKYPDISIVKFDTTV